MGKDEHLILKLFSEEEISRQVQSNQNNIVSLIRQKYIEGYSKLYKKFLTERSEILQQRNMDVANALQIIGDHINAFILENRKEACGELFTRASKDSSTYSEEALEKMRETINVSGVDKFLEDIDNAVKDNAALFFTVYLTSICRQTEIDYSFAITFLTNYNAIFPELYIAEKAEFAKVDQAKLLIKRLENNEIEELKFNLEFHNIIGSLAVYNGPANEKSRIINDILDRIKQANKSLVELLDTVNKDIEKMRSDLVSEAKDLSIELNGFTLLPIDKSTLYTQQHRLERQKIDNRLVEWGETSSAQLQFNQIRQINTGTEEREENRQGDYNTPLQIKDDDINTGGKTVKLKNQSSSTRQQSLNTGRKTTKTKNQSSGTRQQSLNTKPIFGKVAAWLISATMFAALAGVITALLFLVNVPLLYLIIGGSIGLAVTSITSFTMFRVAKNRERKLNTRSASSTKQSIDIDDSSSVSSDSSVDSSEIPQPLRNKGRDRTFSSFQEVSRSMPVYRSNVQNNEALRSIVTGNLNRGANTSYSSVKKSSSLFAGESKSGGMPIYMRNKQSDESQERVDNTVNELSTIKDDDLDTNEIPSWIENITINPKESREKGEAKEDITMPHLSTTYVSSTNPWSNEESELEIRRKAKNARKNNGVDLYS